MDVSGCLSSQTKQFTNYDPSNILQAANVGANTAYSYTQLANSNDLQNLKLGAICLNTVPGTCGVPGFGGIVVCPVGTWLVFGFSLYIGFVASPGLPYAQQSPLPGVITPTTYNGIPIGFVGGQAGSGPVTEILTFDVVCDSAAFTLTTPSYKITLTNASSSASVNGITRKSSVELELGLVVAPTYASSPPEFKAILEASRLPPEGSNTPYRVNITSS